MSALAVSAYAEGLISEARMAQMLRIDPSAARQLASQLLSSLDNDAD
jgi:hypothetical protein